MNTQQAYDQWSEQYDTNRNKTRDLEAIALRQTLARIDFNTCLEIGCGTGKNTVWLVEKAKITAVDLSAEMLAIAKGKNNADQVEFIQADITEEWNFVKSKYELISFSLVLEHIEELDLIFEKAESALTPGGYVYIGELHPFKQYTGSKARFDTPAGQQIVTCFNHNITDFILAAKKYGLQLADITEYFDDNDSATIPRILVLLFKKV